MARASTEVHIDSSNDSQTITEYHNSTLDHGNFSTRSIAHLNGLYEIESPNSVLDPLPDDEVECDSEDVQHPPVSPPPGLENTTSEQAALNNMVIEHLDLNSGASSQGPVSNFVDASPPNGYVSAWGILRASSGGRNPASSSATRRKPRREDKVKFEQTFGYHNGRSEEPAEPIAVQVRQEAGTPGLQFVRE